MGPVYDGYGASGTTVGRGRNVTVIPVKTGTRPDRYSGEKRPLRNLEKCHSERSEEPRKPLNKSADLHKSASIRSP